MRKIILPLFSITIVALSIGCNDKSNNSGKKELTATADSLYKVVLKGHDEGMVGWMKIEDVKAKVQHLLDSINKLPQQAQSAAASLKESLSSSTTELQTAYNSMEKWMEEMNLDSASNNLDMRIKYLTDEAGKVSLMKEAINSSLKKADSLLKSKS